MIQHYPKLLRFIAFVAFLLNQAQPALANEYVTIDGIKYNIINYSNDKRATLEEVTEPIENFTIPASIVHEGEEFPVTRVGKMTSYKYTNLTGTLTIPPTVTTLYAYAFYYASTSEIIIEDGDDKINYYCSSSSDYWTGSILSSCYVFKSSTASRVYLGRNFEVITSTSACPEFGTALKEIEIGAKVSYIPYTMFSNSNAEKVYSFNTTPPSIKDNLFSTKTYSNATLFVDNSAIESYQNASGWKKFKTIVGIEMNATDVSLDNSMISVEVGESVELQASLTPEEVYYNKLTWRSEDESVATVSNGVVTGVSAGETTIEVETENGLIATCYVIVTDPLSSIKDVETNGVGGEAEYFNMQGLRVTPTAPGVYIKRQGLQTSKIIVQ